MFQRFLLKKMMAAQLKGVPPAQQEKILDMIEKNPDFFKKIAEEVQAKVKAGKSQQAASIEVMMGYKDQIQKMMR